MAGCHIKSGIIRALGHQPIKYGIDFIHTAAVLDPAFKGKQWQDHAFGATAFATTDDFKRGKAPA